MSKFTKGPWIINEAQGHCMDKVYIGPGGYDEKKVSLVVCETHYDLNHIDEDKANARLIAGAPTAHALWRKHEWVESRDYDGAKIKVCPECQNEQHDGHADDCKLAAYFRDVEGK